MSRATAKGGAMEFWENLNQRLIKGKKTAKHNERECIESQISIAFVTGDSQKKGEREKTNPLIPAKAAWFEIQNFAIIDAD
jgi:hypothetical protein